MTLAASGHAPSQSLNLRPVATPQRQPDERCMDASPTATTIPGDLGRGSLQDLEGVAASDEMETSSRMSTSKSEVAPTPKASECPNGIIQAQPVIPENVEAEPFEPYDDDDMGLDIPDISDDLAPKPILGAPTLSAAAIRSRSKRIFQKRADGTKKVSDAIWADWHAGGSKRKTLEEIFKRCGYDPDP